MQLLQELLSGAVTACHAQQETHGTFWRSSHTCPTMPNYAQRAAQHCLPLCFQLENRLQNYCDLMTGFESPGFQWKLSLLKARMTRMTRMA